VSDIEYLDVEDLLELIRRLDVGPVRDLGLLDAAAGRPRSTVLGAEAYPTLQEKAAALLHSVARNHAIVDGNKRLAWLATVVFLDLSGHALSLTDDAAVDLVVGVAAGKMDMEAIADCLGGQ
jgi:death-on-curing protein